MNNVIKNTILDNEKEYIYSNKSKIGSSILKLISSRGYTKSSFSKITGISRPTIDKIISAEIESSTTLKTHVQKILNTFNMDLEDLICFEYEEVQNDKIMVASNNAPKDYQMSEDSKKVFQIIDDLVNICEVYLK